MSAFCFVPGTHSFLTAAYAHQVVDAMEEESASIKQVMMLKLANHGYVLHTDIHMCNIITVAFLPPVFDLDFAGCFRAF